VQLQSEFTPVVRLSENPERIRVVFVMGDDGLAMMLGKSGHQRLVAIGLTEDYIRQAVLVERAAFKLLVFPASERDAPPATWEAMVEMASAVFPAVRGKLYWRLGELKGTPFGEIQHQAGFNFSDVARNGPADPRYITPYKLATGLGGSLVEVRLFLYLNMDAMELYAGDGYTRNERWERMLREYLVFDRSLEELTDGYRLIDVPVQL